MRVRFSKRDGQQVTGRVEEDPELESLELIQDYQGPTNDWIGAFHAIHWGFVKRHCKTSFQFWNMDVGSVGFIKNSDVSSTSV